MDEQQNDSSDPDHSDWQPNEEYIQLLMQMGISRNAAEKGLFYTGNQSADLAAAWIFENQGQDLESPLDLNAVGEDLSGEEEEKEEEELEEQKMVFVINSELQMGVGKIASQVAHAALGMHRELLSAEEKFGDRLLMWEELGEKKVTVKGENAQQLVELEKQASRLDLATYLVQDAGRTQVAAGATTVLCVFGKEDIVNQVTGKLKLL